jgi:hypothetical protein
MKRLYTSFLIIALVTVLAGCAEVVPASTDGHPKTQQQTDDSTEQKAVEDVAVQFLKSTLSLYNWSSSEDVKGLDYAAPEIHEDIVYYLPFLYDQIIEHEGKDRLPEVENVTVVKMSNVILGEYRIKTEVTYSSQSPWIRSLQKPELIIQMFDGKPIIAHVVFNTTPRTPGDTEQYQAMSFAQDFLKKVYTVHDAKNRNDTQGLDSVWTKEGRDLIQGTFEEIYDLVHDHASDQETWPVVQTVNLTDIEPIPHEQLLELKAINGYLITAELEFDAQKTYVPFAHPVLVVIKQNDKWAVDLFVNSWSQYLQMADRLDEISL